MHIVDNLPLSSCRCRRVPPCLLIKALVVILSVFIRAVLFLQRWPFIFIAWTTALNSRQLIDSFRSWCVQIPREYVSASARFLAALVPFAAVNPHPWSLASAVTTTSILSPNRCL